MIQKIGLLGSDSSHAERMSEILNLQDYPDYWPDSGARVWAIWGKDPGRTVEVAKNGKIPVVASSPEEVVAESDMVFVITRHGGTHLELARLVAAAGKPLFVDKPLAVTPREAAELLSLVKEAGIPMTSFSALRYASDTHRYGEQLQKIGPVRFAAYIGPAERVNPYGGLVFYGIHCAELMLQHHGTDVLSVHAIEHPAGGDKTNITATCTFGDGTMVSLGLIGDGIYHFHLLAIGREGVSNVPIQSRDYYVRSVREVMAVLRGEKESDISHEEMLCSIHVCAAIEESLQRRAAVDPRELR